MFESQWLKHKDLLTTHKNECDMLNHLQNKDIIMSLIIITVNIITWK